MAYTPVAQRNKQPIDTRINTPLLNAFRSVTSPQPIENPIKVQQPIKQGYVPVAERTTKPILTVREAPQAPTVRVIEGGGFAPLKVSATPVQPKISVTGAKPTAPEPTPTFGQRVSKFVSPSPEGVRPQDVVREIPEAIGDTGKKAAGFAKSVLQEIARSGGSVGLTLAREDKVSLDSSSPKWQQTAQEIIFGKEPVKSLSTRIAEGELRIQPYLKKVGAEKAALPVSFIGVGLLTGLDFTGGGGQKNVLKVLSKADDISFIAKTLRQIGVAEDLVMPTATKMKTISNEKEIATALDKISELQKATRVVSEATKATKELPELPKIPRQAVINEKADNIGRTQNLVDEDQVVFGQIYEELANAEAGQRIFIESSTKSTSDVIGIKSSFPQWIPEDLRSRKLFDKVQDAILKQYIPKNKKELELFTEIQNEYNRRLGIKEEWEASDFEFMREMVEKPKRETTELIGKIKQVFANQKNQAQKKFTSKKAREITGQTPAPKIAKSENVLLRERFKQQATGARAGARAGRNVGQAEGRNIGFTKQQKAVRAEQLKALKGGIKIRAQKDAIITALKNTAESTERIKRLVVEHAKDALSTADRGKALSLVQNAKTRRDLAKAFSRINQWAENTIKKNLRNDILKAQKRVLDSPSVAVDYKERLKNLMSDFELKGHRQSTIDQIKKTQKFLESEMAKGNDVAVPQKVLQSLALLNRTPFEEITLNQLKGLQAEIELLETVGRTKARTFKNLWNIRKQKILDEVGEQGAETIQNIELIKPEVGERLTITDKFKNLIWSAGNQAMRIDRAISPMDTVFDLLDGGKATYAGANFRFFKGQVDAGYGRYISRKSALQEPVIELATKNGLDATNFERMGVVAAREQENGVEKLIASGFTQEQIDAVKLTSQEQEVLDAMRSTFDSQFGEIKDTMRRVYNQNVEKVKNYFSFMTDWKAMDESEVWERFGSQLPEQFGAPRKNVEAGFAISRVGGGQKIKINAMDVFMNHTDNTSYLLEVGETSKLLGEVASSDTYRDLIGETGQLLVREWLDVIARKGGSAGANQIAILDTLRRNVGAGILGLKLSTIAIQPTALIDGAGFIGTKYTIRGASNFAGNSEWRKFIYNMPEIKDRLGGEFALRELVDDNWLQNLQRKGFIPLQTLDQITAGMIAAGAYERKMIELGKAIDLTKGYDAEALAYAQLAVRRTQSSGSFKDVPLAVSKGALTGNRSLDRALLQFQNFLLNRWSRIRHDAFRAGVRTKDPKKAIPIFTAIIMSAIAASGIRLGVNKVQDFITGREDEDTATEDLQKGIVYEMTGNVPFLGTALSMAMYDGAMFPILDAPSGVVSGINRVITSKSESAKLRGFAEFSGSTGALLGIPGSTQAEQLSRGFLQDKKSTSRTPAGLPELPKLPKLPELPKLPSL